MGVEMNESPEEIKAVELTAAFRADIEAVMAKYDVRIDEGYRHGDYSFIGPKLGEFIFGRIRLFVEDLT